jgi:hypothetical protein
MTQALAGCSLSPRQSIVLPPSVSEPTPSLNRKIGGWLPDSMLTDTAIASFANAVFDAAPGVEVLEAYSNYGAVPRRFASAIDLTRYIKEALSTPKGMAHFFVIYPDVAGRPIHKKIHLNPNSIPGETFRYTWEGWGQISVIFEHADQQKRSCSVRANSRKQQ